MTTIKPIKPEPFDGRQDWLVVNVWLYQVTVYHSVLQITETNVVLADSTNIGFATTLMKGTAASWWYMNVQTQTAPDDRENFKQAIKKELVPLDKALFSCDRLRNFVQKASVPSYLRKVLNLTITIPCISRNEKMNIFCTKLKKMVRSEVIKVNMNTMSESPAIALSAYSAMIPRLVAQTQWK